MRSSLDRKYAILTHILDAYVAEGKGIKQRRTCFDTSTEEHLNQARARAFIHLYLAARYGVINFEDRERTITDASHDGGIDAYHFDVEDKALDIIQSKFRVHSQNFESKYIGPEEVLAIDVDRILAGHTEDENGLPYNGHIQRLIDKIQQTPDIARYKTRITILANVRTEHHPLVQRIFHGDETNIVNFDRCYAELVLPTIRGEQHYSASMRLLIDLSNKSGSTRLSAEIETAYGASEVTVVLVPTLEIAQIVSRYKNSILRFNPRSYLEFKEQRTNEGIKQSIVGIETGEFAILNNGLTIVSDATYVSERVGAKNRAQVEIVNPQIINGGQTAFTLARIFDECSDIDRSRFFTGKEVMVRIITLPEVPESDKKKLILSISSATNSQTAVSAVDRTASNDQNRDVAELVFRKLGLLYEPKRGEYSDALRNGFVDRSDIVERVLFSRIMHIACDRYSLGVQRKVMKATGGILPTLTDESVIDEFHQLYQIYLKIIEHRVVTGGDRTINDLVFTVSVRALIKVLHDKGYRPDLSQAIRVTTKLFPQSEQWARENIPDFHKWSTIKYLGEVRPKHDATRWRRSENYPNDIQAFFENAFNDKASLDAFDSIESF